MSYYLMPSGNLPTQNGKLALISQAEFEDCCCYCTAIDSAYPDPSQPHCMITGQVCETSGSFSQYYSYVGVSLGVYTWKDTSSCECAVDDTTLTDVEITLECVNGNWDCGLKLGYDNCGVNNRDQGSNESNSIWVDSNGIFQGDVIVTTDAGNGYTIAFDPA